MKSPTKESKEKLDDCQNRFTRKRRSLHGFNRLRMRCYRDHGIHIIEKETLTLLESIRSEEKLVEVKNKCSAQKLISGFFVPDD